MPPVPPGGQETEDDETTNRGIVTPRITISRVRASVTEGDEVRFVITADVAYSGTLNVNVEVTEDGSFLTGTIPSVITIASGTRTSDLILETDDDGTEEDHGWVHAKIKSGSNYLLGDPTTSSMRVWDNDTAVTPALSIAPFYSPVTEGNNVIFTVTADRAPASLLYFNVGATEIGNYLSYPIATEITMDAGSTVTYYILATIDDDVIEPDGFVTGYIQNGTGYTVGSPSSATVPVTSEDRPDPPTPSNFRVTTATSSSISLAWNSLTGASAYQIQYRLAGAGNWTGPNRSNAANHTLTGLTPNRTYEFQVRTIGDTVTYATGPSNWSWPPVRGSTPTVTIENLGTRLRVGNTDTFRVEARALNSHLNYALAIVADQGTGLRGDSETEDDQVAFGTGSSGCQVKTKNTDIPANNTQFDWDLTLIGCSEGIGVLTAYLFDRGSYTNPALYVILERTTESVYVYIDTPATVSNLTLTPRDKRLEAEWDAPSDDGGGAITRYEFQWKRSSETTWISSPRLTDTERNLINLTNGISYDVQVRACNGPSRCGGWEEATAMPANTAAPTIDSGSSAPPYPENTNVEITPVETYQASDIDGGELTWSLTGTDSGLFNITGTDNNGVLRFRQSPDYEMPRDSNTNNAYVLTVEVSDGELTARKNINVLVSNVNEAPVVSEYIEDQTKSIGDTVTIELGEKFVDPDTGDTLNYAVTSNSNPAVATATTGLTSGRLAITPNAEGSTIITVTAYDADRLSASQTFTVTVEAIPPPPTVTIARHTDIDMEITEGSDAKFTLTATPGPTSRLKVQVRIIEIPDGAWLSPDIELTEGEDGHWRKIVYIPAGQESADFTLSTVNDELDEVDATGTLSVAVWNDPDQPLNPSYLIGSPSSTDVNVLDDDTLPAPSQVYANGNVVNGQVTVWWEPSTGAVAYNLRSAIENCTLNTSDEVAECTPGIWSFAGAVSTTNIKLSAGPSQTDQLAIPDEVYLLDRPTGVYRIQVRAVNALNRVSAWSAPAFIYPSEAPPVGGMVPSSTASFQPLIATASLYGYQPKVEGDHEFRYIVCHQTIPEGAGVDTNDIQGAVESWETAVRKDGANSMIKTTMVSGAIPAGACEPPVPLNLFTIFPAGYNAIIFVNDMEMDQAFCSWRYNFNRVDPRACWRSDTMRITRERVERGILVDLPEMMPGTLLMRTDVSEWNTPGYGNSCNLAEHTIAHEIGHALGIGRVEHPYVEDHPRNSTLSIMSDGHNKVDGQLRHQRYCGPQAYDVVAQMALYQSQP